MNKQTTSDEILNKLYAAYGTDSGILFGIKEMDIVKAIVNFTLDYSHPQTETKVEDVQVGGFTGGIWKYKIYDNEIFNEIEIGVDGLRTCVIPYLEAPAEANAKRIVQAVNNFDAMYSALKDTVYEYENAMKLLAEATGMIYSENNVTISAKAIINNIQ